MMIHTTKTALAALAFVASLSLLAAPAGAQSRREKVAEAEAELTKLKEKIDKDIMWLFHYQVEASSYRSRLAALQKGWKGLMTQFGVSSSYKQASYPPPPASGFRIDAVYGSQELSLTRARLAPGCRGMRGCKLWLRVAFGPSFSRARLRFEVSADLRSRSGSRYAVPTREFTVTRRVMVVEVPLDRVYLPKGMNSGTVKVFSQSRVVRRNFSLSIN
ncbi:MAG: hypothetical protein KC503_21270 [Myxococcales bacterium]|nr:hypothetical protein [Myxococcales bacterium]